MIDLRTVSIAELEGHGCGTRIINELEKNGYLSMRDVLHATTKELRGLPNIGKASVDNIVMAARAYCLKNGIPVQD